MTSPGGVSLLTNRPIKILIEVYPGQDMEAFLRVPAGGEPWPSGTSAEMRFYDGPTDSATVLHTATLEVDTAGQFLYVRVESADLESLPDRAVVAVYASLPTSPTTDWLIGTGVTKKMKRG